MPEEHAGNAHEEIDVSDGLVEGEQERTSSRRKMRTNDWAYKRGALGSRLQALPSDAQLAKVRSQAVKACTAGLARGLHITCCQEAGGEVGAQPL